MVVFPYHAIDREGMAGGGGKLVSGPPGTGLITNSIYVRVFSRGGGGRRPVSR